MSKVDHEFCIHLLNSKFNELSEANLIDMINKHNDLKNLLIYRKQVSFNINAESYKLLNELRERHIISSYTEKNNKLIAYTKQTIDV